MSKSWEEQIGGNHYKNLAIQPMEYSMKNNLNPLQHTIIKYTTRYPDKDNAIVDLKKARHCVDMLIEHEGGESENLLSHIESRIESLTRTRDQLFSMGNDYIGEKTVSKLLKAYEMVLKDVKFKKL
jgi:hypothetical protein